MADNKKRTFSEIAQEVLSFGGALPYLQALLECNTTNKNALYYFETVESVTNYLLSNLTSWKGDDARRIKDELKSMIK